MNVGTIQQAVQAQLSAFSRGDYEAAFEMTSPGIQEQFGDAETMAEVVRRRYPELIRSRSVVFGRPGNVRDRVAQPVEVTGEDGVTLVTLFLLVRLGDDWRIDGLLEVQTAPEHVGYVN